MRSSAVVKVPDTPYEIVIVDDLAGPDLVLLEHTIFVRSTGDDAADVETARIALEQACTTKL